jgi:hypothetical protein
MYVYHEYFEANRVVLIYPNSSSNVSSGMYLDKKTNDVNQKNVVWYQFVNKKQVARLKW